MDFSVRISGVEKLDRTFLNMPGSTQRKVYNKALRRGGKVVKDAATVNIMKVSKKFTGVLSLKSSVAMYNGRKRKGNFRLLIHVKRGLMNHKVLAKGFKKPVRVGLYASVLEYGSKKLNRVPRPWIRPAIRENTTSVVNNITDEFKIRMNEVVKDARR